MAWPHGVERIISKLSHMCCNQGELLPSYILSGSHSNLSGSKHSHSYLIYPWNQLKVIDMLKDHAWGYLQNCCYSKTTLNGPAACVPSPSSDLWGWGHPIFLIFPGHPEFWTPLQIPLWGGSPGCTLLHFFYYHLSTCSLFHLHPSLPHYNQTGVCVHEFFLKFIFNSHMCYIEVNFIF